MTKEDAIAILDRSSEIMVRTGDTSGYLADVNIIKEVGAVPVHDLWRLANAFVWLHGGGEQPVMTEH